jgi:hypothetical protein
VKTFITLEIDHDVPIPELASKIAGRAYSISGVTNAEAVPERDAGVLELRAQGFTPQEIALGSREVVRS